MKKLSSIVLSLLLVLTLAACSGENGEDDNNNGDDSNGNDDIVFEEIYGPAIDMSGQMPTFIGNRTLVLEIGDTYEEFGIDYAGDYTVTSDVDTDVEGRYKVRYYDNDQLLLVRDVIVTETIIEVSSREDLNAIRNNLSGHYILTDDIDLERQRFTPIGSENNPFTGTFNGNNHTISNLRIDREVESSVNAYQGMFSVIRQGYIGNVTLDNVDIKIDNLSPASTDVDTGALVGFLNRSIAENIRINGGKVVGDNLVGGVFGFANLSSITNVYANVDVSGTNRIGGIVGGLFGSQLHYAMHEGHVQGNQEVAGIVGVMVQQQSGNNDIPSELYQVVHRGSITGRTYVGGIAGLTYVVNINRAYSDTTITITATGSSLQGHVNGYQMTQGNFKNNYSLDRDIINEAEEVRFSQDENVSGNKLVNEDVLTEAWYFDTLNLDSNYFTYTEGKITLLP